jgi:hypothetical protein
MNRQEIRKAGFLSGIEVSYFGEIISSKTRKFYDSISKAKGQNLKIFKKLVKEAKKLNIFDITVLECDKWVGDYGLVARDINSLREYQIHYSLHADVKYIYNIVRELYNSHKRDRFLFIPIETIDDSDAFHLFYIPEKYKIIKYGPNDNELLICMHNGQYFDIGYSYYYSKKDSKILREEMKKGYVYECPSYFYKYIEPYEESEDYDESEYGSPE